MAPAIRMAYDVCFGYELRSDLAFEYLREGGATGVLEVAETQRDDAGESGEPLREWLPRPDRPFTARLFREDHRWRLWVADIGSFHIDPAAGSIEVPREAPPLLREERLWGIPTVLCFLSRGDHSLHAASVETRGRAVVFGAPGRFGKTTLAAALVGAGYRLLSEDSTCLRISAEDVAVVPGPAMLRVRRDPDPPQEVPGDGSSRSTSVSISRSNPRSVGRGTRSRSMRSCSSGRRTTRTRASNGSPPRRRSDWALSFSTPTDEDRRRCFDGVTQLAARVPIWNLHRPMRYDALDAVIRELERVPGR